MPLHLSTTSPTFGEGLTPNVFGLLVGKFQFASHRPLKSGNYNSRHIYLALTVNDGTHGGPYEAAVNIRSDAGTEVLYTKRIQNLGTAAAPAEGFQAGVKFAYGTGTDGDSVGLADGDFHSIENDNLYSTLSDLAQSSDRVAVYGVTYKEGDGIHDVHMNSGTDPADQHAGQDRVHQDGAIVFYNAMPIGGLTQTLGTWIFVKFDSQSVVNG